MREMIFVLFLLSGMIKTFLDYFGIHIFDVTLLFGLLLTIILLKDIISNNYEIYMNTDSIYAIQLLILLFVWIVFSFFYSSSNFYLYEKTIRFLTILLAFVFPLISKNFFVKRFFIYFSLIGTLMAIIYLPLFLNSHIRYSGGKEVEGIFTAYLAMGYIIAITIIINIFTTQFVPITRTIMLGTLFLILLVTGARGPLLIMSITIILYPFWKLFKKDFTYKKSTKKVIILGAILSVFALPYVVNKFDLSNILERSYNRVTALASIEGDESASDRLHQFQFVLDKTDINMVLLGYGFGSYGYERYSIDDHAYPHNVILEIFFELGTIGLIIFLMFLFVLLKSLWTKSDFWKWAIFIYLFLNALKSLSLVDARIMFGFFAILLLGPKKEKLMRVKNAR